VTVVSVVEGAVVAAGDPLFTIADLSAVWVWCDVFERDLAALDEALAGGEPAAAVVRVASSPDRAFSGRVDLLGSEVDETTRTLKARVVVDNHDGRLRPGMFARVEVSLPRAGTVRLVPRTAVLSDGGASFVFLKWRDDFWVRRDVVVAEVRGEHAAVEGDLPEGAVVAARGAFMLKSDVLRDKMGAG
jgi:RND family efflux transporter MFP subunit